MPAMPIIPTMPTMLNSLLESLRNTDYQAFRGARLEFVLPMTKGFLNVNLDKFEVGAIKRADIVFIDAVNVSLNVQTSIPFFKNRTIEGIIFEKLEPPRFILRIEIEDGLNALERGVLGRLLPDGIDLDGRMLQVDLRHFLQRRPNLLPLLDRIHDVRLVGERDRFMLKFKFSV
jgi:hypothetical protein